MEYFSQFPTMIYDIKGNNNYKLIPDIFRKVKVVNKIKGNVSLIDTYEVDDGEKPEHVAYRVYGNANYFWVVCMMNDIKNIYYDWPLSNLQFENFVKDKYDEPEAIHHYEKIQSSGKQIGDGPGDYSQMIECNSIDEGSGPVSNAEYERRIQDKKRQIRILDPKYLNTFVTEFNTLIRK